MRKSMFWAACLAAFLVGVLPVSAQTMKSYDSYKGLVMAGYQGWFSTPGDGGTRGWYRYQGKDGTFRPGFSNVDLWPDVSEYEKTYETQFTLGNGQKARVFSSRDASTVDLHFKWMKQYGIDGVFVQRFVVLQKIPEAKAHHDDVLKNAMNAGRKYERAVCVMYDLSDTGPGDEKVLLNDIRLLAVKYNLFNHGSCPQYLYHNGKPLVAVFGVGFDEGRRYGFKETETIIKGLKELGFSVMLGVPTYWRQMEKDALKDPRLHQQIKMCDIVLPWFVGRYNEDSYPGFKQLILEDMKWAKANHVDYAPVCFPGFSWRNMNYHNNKNVTGIPRNKGSFYKKQLDFCAANTEMIYIAMFDEIDEGTAIFKIAKKVPTATPGSEFLPRDKGSAYYMKLTGKAAKKLRKRLGVK